MQATPQSDTVSPVTVAELAPIIGVASDDLLLPVMLVAATDAVIRYINLDLMERDWIGIVPAQGYSRPQVSVTLDPLDMFELPYTGLVAVDSVTCGGEELEYTVQEKRRPARITVQGWDRTKELEIAYTAGMETIPAAIKYGIMQVATYLYDHRGDCDADDAIRKSGAANLLKPYRVEVAL